MDQLNNATSADVLVAFLVLLNTALLAWGNWQRTRQNAGISRKVDHLHEELCHPNGDGDAPTSGPLA